MAKRKLTKLQLQILEAFWARGTASVRDIQESFPDPRPAYTTVQTTVYRLEKKRAVRRIGKVGNAHVFEPIVAREVVRHRLLDEVLALFGGHAQPMMVQLADRGDLTLRDIRELEAIVRRRDREPDTGPPDRKRQR